MRSGSWLSSGKRARAAQDFGAADENATVSGAHGSALTAGSAASSRETANPRVFPEQEQHPYTHHAAGESTLIEQGRSTAQGVSS